MAWARPRCPWISAARRPSVGKREKGGLRKVRHAGAREGGRRGAPHAQARHVHTLRGGGASMRGVGGRAGRDAGQTGRGWQRRGRLRAPRAGAPLAGVRARRERTPASGALGPELALGRGARQAARPAPSPFNAPTKSVRPRHLLRPRAAMCHVKGPSARRPQPRPVPRDQKRGKDSLNAPFDGREAVERGVRRAKFAAVFGLRHCGLWEGGKQRGKHHVFLRPLTPPVTPPPRNVSMPPYPPPRAL